MWVLARQCREEERGLGYGHERSPPPKHWTWLGLQAKLERSRNAGGSRGCTGNGCRGVDRACQNCKEQGEDSCAGPGTGCGSMPGGRRTWVGGSCWRNGVAAVAGMGHGRRALQALSMSAGLGQVILIDGWRQLVCRAVVAGVAGTAAGTRPSHLLPSVLGTPGGRGAGRRRNRGRWQSGTVKQSSHSAHHQASRALQQPK